MNVGGVSRSEKNPVSGKSLAGTPLQNGFENQEEIQSIPNNLQLQTS